MSSLSDIKAHCERDKARIDSEHEQIDRFSSDGKSSNGGSVPKAPEAISPYAPPPGGSNPAVVAIAVLAVLALVVVAVLVLLVLPSERSPTDVYRQYVNASNDRDIKRMFDQTVTQFSPDYEQRLGNLSSVVFFLDPMIEIVDLGVTSKANMSGVQTLAAQVITDDVETRLSVGVDDYCYVHYSVKVNYRDIDQTAAFDGEMLCVKIDGRWLLVVPGYY